VEEAIRSGTTAREVRDRFPTDYFAHRFYQNQSIKRGLFTNEVQEEYRALLEQHDDDPLYLLLYARVLTGTDTKHTLGLLEQVLAKEPDNPQAHLKMVEIYSAPAFSDHAKLREHAEAYWTACPESLSAFSHIGRIRDPGFNAAAAARLRPLLEKRDDDEALQLFRSLWAMEFRGVGLANQDPVRERIRQDAVRLRAMDTTNRQWLVSELRQAYQYLSDQAGIEWADARLPKRESATAEMISKWRAAHSKPGEDYLEAIERMAKQTEEWIRQFPDDAYVRYERYRALENLDSVPIEEAVQAAEEWIQVYERHPSGQSPYITVANFFAWRRVRFDEIPALLEKALKGLPPPGPSSDLYPPRYTGYSTSLYDREAAARIYLQLKKYDRARELLDQVIPLLEKAKPGETASDAERRRYASEESSVYNSAQRLAQIDGRQEDALNYGRRYALASTISYPDRAETYRSNLLRQWKQVRGSEDGFDAWFGKPKPAGTRARPTEARSSGGWIELSKPLPEFKLQDAAGKTWQLSDLKGKVTLVNLWATWCGPCRTELPYLEKLAGRLQDRKDLAVLTLNVDDSLGLVLPFLKENHYSFPVLAAADYVNGIVKELSIPRNWIVDAEGVLRRERVGFLAGDDRWIDEMIAAMEKARQRQ
jgi:thiol-disulfide isomerase/thioredoxin